MASFRDLTVLCTLAGDFYTRYWYTTTRLQHEGQNATKDAKLVDFIFIVLKLKAIDGELFRNRITVLSDLIQVQVVDV